jgi:hypothetical protein
MPMRFVLRLFTFYFPGWHAYVDGQEVEIMIGDPEGFITLWVPEGEHEVVVQFEDTPPRTTGWIVSAVGLGMLAVSLALVRGADIPICQPSSSDFRSLVWLGGVLLLFVILKSGVIDLRDDWLRYTSPPGEAWAAQHELRANFSNQIELLGYDLPRQQVRAGEEFSIVLYWRTLMPLSVNYQSFVHLAQPIHVLWGQDDHINPGDVPTTRWPLNRYVWDEYEIRVLPETPPGEYLINVGLYSADGGYRLLRYDEEGQVIGDSIVIASIQVIE